MKFWQLNKYKILRMVVVSSVFLCSLGLYFDWKDNELRQPLVVILSLLAAVLSSGYVVMNGVIAFNGIKRLQNDTSEKAMIHLFDNGFTMKLADEKSWILMTTENFVGRINGFPTEVSYEPSSKYSGAGLTFIFEPLYKPGQKDATIKSIKFDLLAKYQLKEETKPNLLHFIEDLKQQGYSVERT